MSLKTILGYLALGLASSPAAAQSGRPTLSLAPYTLGTYDGGTYEIEVGKIVVPESRGRTGGPTVTVGFYRLRTTATSPGSPIVFLMGGPGIPATLMAPIPPYWALFDRLRAVGDVIVLDQRGLGLSTPLLNCPPPPERVDTALLTSPARFAAAYRAVVASCAAHWRAQGVDPRAYSDDAIADDVDAIRDALGAARINLLAFSYGTKLAMAYARRHPDQLDRVVLQGATDGELMYRSSLRYDTVLVRMARRAESDSIAGAFSRGLVTRVRALIDRSGRDPFLVRIRTVSGDSLTIPVGQSGLQAVISGRIADPRIPALVATLETGDATILTYWVQSLYNDFSTGAGSLMARALPCSTPPSAMRRTRIDTEGKGSLFGLSADNAVLLEPFCSALGGNPPAPTPRLAAPLARPALFITGEDDDRTPPSNAETLAAEFADPVNLVVSNGGHELLTSPGVRDAVVTFFRGEDVRGVALRAPPSPFLTIEAARSPPRRPGQ